MGKENEHSLIYSPNSIYHGMEIHSSNGRLPLSDIVLLKIETERLRDFIEFLFEHSEHCDHISQKDAWNEFEIYEIKNSRYRKMIKEKRKKIRE